MPTLREQLAEDPTELQQLIEVIARRLVGDEADGLIREVREWIGDHLARDYPWPGNVRELEQCVRSILVQGPHARPLRSPSMTPGKGSSLRDRIEAGEVSADTVLREYIRRVYDRTGSYEAAARVLELDRRTVKAKLTA